MHSLQDGCREPHNPSEIYESLDEERAPPTLQLLLELTCIVTGQMLRCYVKKCPADSGTQLGAQQCPHSDSAKFSFIIRDTTISISRASFRVQLYSKCLLYGWIITYEKIACKELYTYPIPITLNFTFIQNEMTIRVKSTIAKPPLKDEQRAMMGLSWKHTTH